MSRMKKDAIRQGDVIPVLVDTLPNLVGAKAIPKNKAILAYGEHTGHQHQLIGGEFELKEKDGTLYLVVEDETTLFHGTPTQISRQRTKGSKFDFAKEDCHRPLTIQKGNYEIKRQQQYEPEGWQRVAD